MTGENIVTGTWLPVFPGFYGTFFDGESMLDNEIMNIEETIKPRELADCMIDNLCYSDAYTKLCSEYQQSVAVQCVKLIKNELFPEFVSDMKFEEIRSPKEYNFVNDSINIEVVFSADNIVNIEKFIQEHFDQWKEYLKESFTSRSGFMSFYGNTPDCDDWRDLKEVLNHSTKSGAVLEFLCGEKEITSEFLFMQCSNDVSLDVEMLRYECLKNGWYETKKFKSLKSWIINHLPHFLFVDKWYGLLCIKPYHFSYNKNGHQFICETSKQRYIFAVTTQQVKNNNFIVKRLFKVFVFGKLKDGKR